MGGNLLVRIVATLCNIRCSEYEHLVGRWWTIYFYEQINGHHTMNTTMNLLFYLKKPKGYSVGSIQFTYE
jgi:hypothetical protein